MHNWYCYLSEIRCFEWNQRILEGTPWGNYSQRPIVRRWLSFLPVTFLSCSLFLQLWQDFSTKTSFPFVQLLCSKGILLIFWLSSLLCFHQFFVIVNVFFHFRIWDVIFSQIFVKILQIWRKSQFDAKCQLLWHFVYFSLFVISFFCSQ